MSGPLPRPQSIPRKAFQRTAAFTMDRQAQALQFLHGLIQEQAVKLEQQAQVIADLCVARDAMQVEIAALKAPRGD